MSAVAGINQQSGDRQPVSNLSERLFRDVTDSQANRRIGELVNW